MRPEGPSAPSAFIGHKEPPTVAPGHSRVFTTKYRSGRDYERTLTSETPSGDATPPTAADDPAPTDGKTGWRDRLPRVPDPIRVDLPGLTAKQALYGWLGLSLVLLIAGVWINWSLTDGAWVLPEQSVYDATNPLGETRTQFLTTHPYDLITAGLFVGSNVLLGLSLVRTGAHRRNPAMWVGGATVAAGLLFPALAHRIGGIGSVEDTAGLSVAGAYSSPLFLAFAGLTVLIGGAILALTASRRLFPATPHLSLTTRLRALGWTLFAFHWAAVAMQLFHAEEGDWVNTGFAFASVFVLTYFAYQEFVSRRLGTDNKSLRFAAGAVFLASIVWYAFLKVEFLAEWIIETVAGHTVWMLQLFGQDVAITEDGRTGFTSAIFYPEFAGRTVIIILACTAIQSMMIFVAAALAVDKADWSRRFAVIGVTVPIVYILNLMRNTIIIFLWETRWLELRLGIGSDAAFGIAHNWIGKFGSLIALVLIAMFVFRVLPEVVQAVVGLLDLPRRRGPLEQGWLQARGRGDEVEKTPPAGTPTTPPAQDPPSVPEA